MGELRNLHLVLVLIAATGGFAIAQEGAEATPEPASEAGSKEQDERTLQRLRSMLEQRPTHAALFDRYFKALVELNSIETEIEALRQRSETDPDASRSVVLGRLLLRTGKEEDALEVLEAIPDKSEAIQQVLGDIQFKLARFDSAARAFTAALPAARTSEEKRVLYEKIGRAQLALGRKDRALETWGKIAALDGGKFYRRLHVAELLVGAGLLDEAGSAYEPLLAETAGDPARHCQVLRDVGRLKELRGDLDGALKVYGEVLDLTGRGNWLRKEVEKRIVQIYRRTGELEALVARLEEQVASAVDDLATSELLANVLTEMRELDRAATVLARMSPRFPKDVRLARRVAELHIERGDVDAAIAEYQRILNERPEELELYLELGTLFAKSERLNEAKNQWEKALAQNLNDASLCMRLASMYALWDRDEDAVRLYRRAIELEPESMVRFIDLAEYLFALKRPDEAVEVLDQAIVVAEGKPRRLETLAAPLREHDLNTRARACLEGILAIEHDNHEVRYALADLLLLEGQRELAWPLLWEIVDADDRGSGHRTMAANTLVNLAARSRETDQLLAEAESKDTAGSAFVMGRAHSRRREFDLAIADYRRALERNPSDIEARRLLARLYAEEGDHRAALREYERLGVIAPGERRQHFREVARLHLEMYDLEEAIDTWKRAMRDNPDNAAVFVQVGKEFLDINRIQEALEAFEQAARLRSRDPDILLRLADAMRQAGKAEEAEEHLMRVATTALDSRDRRHARTKLFELIAEQGQIDSRIESLQSAIAENPYDLDSPQLLADLYMRTGDFVLGLEMVDQSLKFQPRNQELLSRRAELLESLEEWDKAHDVHQELLKFPDVDRDEHLAGMGRAKYEVGRAEEAKEVFRKIRDRGRLRKLYQQYRLHDEAVEYYTRAIARNPGDLRSYLYLAEELEKLSRRKDAITVLERVLNLRPYYRQALQLVGKLYVQDGRRDESVKVGMRLFGLRGEDVEKNRREEWEEEEQNRRWGWGYRRNRSQPFNQQRLQAAQGYFNERGLKDEWGRILVAEAKRRPTDLTLYNAVRSHYKWQEKSASKFVAFIRELMASDFSKLRVPPGYTHRSYQEKLEGDLFDVYKEDASVAEKRLAELDGDGRTPAELLERAKIRKSIGQLADVRTDLDALLAAEPTNPVANALMVELSVEEKDYAAAITPLRALLDWWRGPGEEYADEIGQRLEVSFRQQRKSLRDSLPRRIRRRVNDDDLREMLARTRTQSFGKTRSISFPEALPQPFACVLKLIRLQKAAGDTEGLRATVAQAPTLAENIAQLASLGQVLFQEGLEEEAERVLAAVVSDAEEIKADAIQVYFWGRYQSAINIAAGPLGELLAKRGEVLEAYRILRSYGQGQKAELLLRQSDKVDDLRAMLEREVEEKRALLEAARQATTGELRASELDYRDAVIKFADYYVGEKDYAKAEEVYRSSIELLPDDIEIRSVVAKLCERRGEYELAIATHREIVDVKRRRKRATGGDTAIPPTRLQPRLPDQTPEASMNVSSGVAYSPGPVYYSGGYYYPSYYGSGNRFDISQNYNEILRLYTQRNRNDGVLDTLRKLIQEDPASFRRMSYQVLNTLRNHDLGKKKLPVLRILKGVVKDDEWLTFEYAKACAQEDELKEARRTLEKMIAKNLGTGNYYADQAEAELKKVLQKMGEGNIDAEKLRAEVEKDPSNVRHRMRLARRLEEDHDYAGALEQALIVVEKAPYMTKAKEMVVDAAAAVGNDGLAISMLRRLFDESTNTNETLSRGVNLANWLYAAGEEEEAFSLIERLNEQSGGSQNYSAGNWFLDKDQMEKAITHYEKEMERAKAQQYQLNQLRQRVSRLEMATAKETDAIARYLDALEEAGTLQDREARWKDLLRAIKGHPDPAALERALEAEYGDRQSVQDLLVMAGIAFARGDVERAEAEVRRIIEVSPKEVYLFPLLLGLRRLDDDWEGALAVLEQMGRVYGGSETMQWNNGVTLNERDRLKLVRVEILEKMGRDEDAKELMESLVDATVPTTLMTLSNIYKQKNRYEEALEWYRRYRERIGTKEQSHLIAEAQILLEMDRMAEAEALVEEAYLMARGNRQTRDLLLTIHRELGTLDEFVAELEKDLEKDFRDASLRSTLLLIYKEKERDQDRKAIFERMLQEDDLEESALNSLASEANEDGRFEEQIGYLTQLLELKGGEQKKRMHRQISDLYIEIGDIDKAAESYREAIEVDTADGLLDLGQWYLRHDRKDEALEALNKVLELDENNERVLGPMLETMWRRGEGRQVVDLMHRKLEKNRGKSALFSGSSRTWLLDALHGLPEDERREVLAGGEDVESLEKAALAHLAMAEFETALERAEAALAIEPERIIAISVQQEALRELERWDELFVASEQLRQTLEREYLISADWNYYNRAQELQNQLGRIELLKGNEARADEVWRQSPLRRTPYSNPFGYWRSDWGVRYTAELWMDVRRPERALEALEREFLLRESPPWSTYTRALEAVGRVDEVEKLAWHRFLDPMELYGVQSGDYGWVWVGGEYRQASGMQEFLVNLYRKQNRIEELRARAEQLRADPASAKRAEELLEAIARVVEDHRFLVEREEQRMAERSGEPTLQQAFNMAKMWYEAGEPDKALAYMAKVLDFDKPELDQHYRPRKRSSTTRYYYYDSGQSAAKNNPFSFNFSGGYYSSWWSSSRSGSLEQQRMAAAAFLIRAGDRERAKLVEDDLLDQPSDRRRKEKMIALARSYSGYELPEECARLVRAVLSSDVFEIKDQERGTLLSLLSAALKKIGDEDGRREILESRRQLLHKRIAEAPGPHAFSLRYSLARLLVLEMDQAEGGLEEIDYLLGFMPRTASYISLRARALDSLGRSAEAVEVLRALSETKRRDGDKDSVTEEAWLGIALAHAGDKAAAKEVLTSVLQRLAPDSDLREEATEIIESL